MSSALPSHECSDVDVADARNPPSSAFASVRVSLRERRSRKPYADHAHAPAAPDEQKTP